MSNGKLKISTCQFAVGKSIVRNGSAIVKFIEQAAKSGADIVHFSECALSGYVGTDFASFDNFNWDLLRQQIERITSLARQLNIWVVLGSAHREKTSEKPYNSLYLIGPDGEIADRYDKRFCTIGDLKRHSSGDHFVYFDINGVKCSLLICFEVRFPEIYRHLYKQGVNCVFQSFYNARQSGRSIHTDIMQQSMQCRAASNYLWASMSNSSGFYSPYPSCFIQPDGRIANKLKLNRPGIMTNTLDLNKKFYDPMKEFRQMAISGKFDNSTES